LTDVAEHAAPENLFLATAILWSVKLQNLKKVRSGAVQFGGNKLYKVCENSTLCLLKTGSRRILIEISRRRKTQTAEITGAAPPVCLRREKTALKFRGQKINYCARRMKSSNSRPKKLTFSSPSTAKLCVLRHCIQLVFVESAMREKGGSALNGEF